MVILISISAVHWITFSLLYWIGNVQILPSELSFNSCVVNSCIVSTLGPKVTWTEFSILLPLCIFELNMAQTDFWKTHPCKFYEFIFVQNLVVS